MSSPSEIYSLLCIPSISMLLVLARLVHNHLNTIPFTFALLCTMSCNHVELTYPILRGEGGREKALQQGAEKAGALVSSETKGFTSSTENGIHILYSFSSMLTQSSKRGASCLCARQLAHPSPFPVFSGKGRL